MPQETNLNVSPYFDDFDPQKNYYKVLFKPGYPVQARELTGLQSILQDQVEKFGNHVFKEGSVVIPGALHYNITEAVVLENTFNGLNIDSYIDNLLNKVIIGQDSGVKAKVVYILKQNKADNQNTILYLNYINTSDAGNTKFNNSENILVESIVSPGFSNITAIQANQAFATTISSGSTARGSLVILSEGVYFLRGYFVSVPSQTLVLDALSTNPTYKVGFTILENIVNSDIDSTLVDNAKGFSNYAAPGADRFQINAILSKVPFTLLNQQISSNFVDLITIENGILTRNQSNPQYNVLADEFARRTYDESGDYYVKPFKLEVKNSLDDNKGNEGVYSAGQLTYQGEVPSDDLGAYKISPGKAYVKGYELELLSTSLVDFEKPRTTKTLENQSIIYSTGATYSLNRVYGSPTIGISTYVVSLRDSRVGVNRYLPSGKEIGVARVYDFALESGSYDSAFPETNQWEISLYDIQTYTEITLNQPITLSTPVHIKGKASGATAYLRFNASNSGIITAYNTNGTFAKGEMFIFNGIDNTRIATAITSYNTGDVESLYGITGTASTFTADTKQYTYANVGSVNITATSGGISTVTSSDFNFVGVATAGNLVSYSNAGTTPVFSVVKSVSNRTLTISGVTTVTGVCEGALPTSIINPSDFKILKSSFLNSTNDALFTPVGKRYISSVDLLDSQLTIRKQFDATISSRSLNIAPTEILSNEVFLPFDEERYVLIRNDGTTEPLSADQFVFSSGGKQLTINGLSSDGNARLIATLQKTNIKSRIKNKNRVGSVLIDKSSLSQSGTNTGVGNTTNNDGLKYGNYPYGTRVQDEEICLNVPDVTKIYAIFESSGIQDPSAPSALLQNISSQSGTTTPILIGEEIRGLTSGCVAICLGKPNSLTVEYVTLNDIGFIEGESVTFAESGVTASVNTLNAGSNNIRSNFSLGSGQRKTILDYSRITRRNSSSAPTRKIKIYYESASIPSSDTGDITIVDSYSQFDYCDLPTVDQFRVSDIIDTRPIVDVFTPDTATRSPFEFYGRSFDKNQNSSLDVLASDELILCNYSFYLGRIDRIYLSTSTNNFRTSDVTAKTPIILVKQGTPSESPQLPDDITNALEIGRVVLPPYLCNTRDAGISLIEHKRYRMDDIARLETRIKNLEFYSSLSLLENNAKNLQIRDSKNLDRFKSGIFVDNFTNIDSQRRTLDIKNSIDRENGELRPSPYTTEVDMLLGSRSMVGIGTSLNPNADIKYVTDLIGNNIRRSGINPNSIGKGVITLNYNLALEISQPYATRIENVTPYLVTSYSGIVELNPSSDIWVDQVRLESLTVEGVGGTTTVTELQGQANDFNPQQGWNPISWNAWQNNWTGSNTTTTTDGFIDRITTTDTGTAVRTGSTSRIVTTNSTASLGNRVVNVDVAPFLRSRNIEFNGKNLRPFSRVYAFFDKQNVNQFIVPKLIEIEMLEGVFIVGETIRSSNIANNQETPLQPGTREFRARCATANHRYGPFNSPVDTYIYNPYNQTQVLPSTYTSASTVLNIDTVSMSDFCSFNFYGHIFEGMILVGGTSGARARVRDVRLITDRAGVVIGSFFVPNPNVPSNPSFRTGIKTLRLTSNSTNSPIPGELLSTAETNFFAEGTIAQNQQTILSIRNTEVQNATISESRPITQTSTTTIDRTPPPPPPPPWTPPPPNWNPLPPSSSAYVNPVPYVNPFTGRPDPLAQSFFIGSEDDSTGRYVTSIELYFQSKDDTLPVAIQLRPMSLGTPTTEVYPFSQVVLYPDQINVSDDASVPTFINFQSPVYLEGNKEHCLVVLSNSTEYSVWISRLGEVDISTAGGAESAQVFVTSQTFLGSMFKSQNASTWTPSQYEDIKFNLYTARFDEEGSISFFSPELTENNRQIATLDKDSLQLTSRKIRVGLGTTISDSNLIIGNRIIQANSNATGTYVGAGGSAIGNLNIINAGIGYTPSTGTLTYNNVSLTPVTGTGRDAKANITITNGVAIAATISQGGTGYLIGDVLTASSIGINSVGRNLRLSVVGIAGTNELIIDNVQGDYVVGAGNTLYYSSSVGAGITPIGGGNVFITSTPIVVSDGLHIKVNHKNHGMHSPTNTVKIFGVRSDVEPARILNEYSSTSTANIPISVGFSSSFATFENVGVGTTNLGYALIEDEIISYSGVVGGNLIGITRGVDFTQVVTHPTNSYIYKYELDGVSLRRINTTHQLQNATISERIGLDYYTIKVGMATNGVDRTLNSGYPNLYFNTTKSSGGSSIKATQNIPFEMVRPIVQTVVHPKTGISAEIRTTSGTSISGSEVSFEDKGFQSISLDENNYFSDPRIIASRVNETSKLTNIPGNKSMELRLNLRTSDNRLTPVIDLDRVGMICVSNRVNQVITDFATDPRVSTLRDDPSAFIYAIKPIQLEIPATSLKVLVSAYINPYADLKALYAIMNDPSKEPIYYPFPGYLNRIESGQVIDPANNDGSSDEFVSKNNTLGFESNEITFKDYEFTVDNLEPFKYFSIKLVGSSTNQAYPPRLRDFRVIGVA